MQIQARLIVKYNRLPEIAGRLPELNRQVGRTYMNDALLPRAKANQAPHIDTGALYESGVVEDGGDTFTMRFTGGALNRSGEPRTYALYHEEGTRFTAAYPFAVPAVDQTFPGEAIAAAVTVFSSL